MHARIDRDLKATFHLITTHSKSNPKSYKFLRVKLLVEVTIQKLENSLEVYGILTT